VVRFSISGLRVDYDNERVGLDLTEHGEEGYIIE
jgi:ammonia channel protein AmtB